mgnify:FL=1
MGSNELVGPFGIQRDSITGTLYIADQDSDRIVSYSLNASFGNVIIENNLTLANRPISLYYDSFSKSLLIANYNSHNVIRWFLERNSSQLCIGTLPGSPGSTSIRLNRPTDVTLDPMGNIYIADYNNHRIQFFAIDQSNGSTIAGMTSTLGNTSDLLNLPFSIDLDSQLNLYVADSANHRIQKFVRY